MGYHIKAHRHTPDLGENWRDSVSHPFNNVSRAERGTVENRHTAGNRAGSARSHLLLLVAKHVFSGYVRHSHRRLFKYVASIDTD